MNDLRNIILRINRPAPPQQTDPYAKAKDILRGSMMIPSKDPNDQDTEPSLWSQTAYDIVKYNHLRKVAESLPFRALSGATHMAAMPLHLAGAVAQRAGVPVDQIMQDPVKLKFLAQLVSNLPENLDRLTGHEHDPDFVARRHWM